MLLIVDIFFDVHAIDWYDGPLAQAINNIFSRMMNTNVSNGHNMLRLSCLSCVSRNVLCTQTFVYTISSCFSCWNCQAKKSERCKYIILVSGAGSINTIQYLAYDLQRHVLCSVFMFEIEEENFHDVLFMLPSSILCQWKQHLARYFDYPSQQLPSLSMTQ